MSFFILSRIFVSTQGTTSWAPPLWHDLTSSVSFLLVNTYWNVTLVFKVTHHHGAAGNSDSQFKAPFIKVTGAPRLSPNAAFLAP
jgi:hypothetical protein